MRPPDGTIDQDSPYVLHQCTQCFKLAYTQKKTNDKGIEAYWLSCDCPIAKPWNWIQTPGHTKMREKLMELRDNGTWTDTNDVPRDECGTPQLEDTP